MRYHRKSYSEQGLDDTVNHVVQHISSCCSATDDPDEFAALVEVEIGDNNEDGSFTITGTLEGYEPNAAYLGFTGYPDVPRNKSSTVHEPVDFTPDQLQAHLQRKLGVES